MKKACGAMVTGFALFALCAVFAGGAAAQAQVPHNSHVFNAYRMLTRAHYLLRLGTHAGEARRHQALQQVSAALQDVRSMAAASKQSLPALSEANAPVVTTTEIHHHAWMRDALRQCQDASAQLQAAQNDSGGHRNSAIQHLNAAIALLQQIVKQQ